MARTILSMYSFTLTDNHHDHPIKVLLLSPFHCWKNWRTESVSDLPKVPQLMSSRARAWTQAVSSKSGSALLPPLTAPHCPSLPLTAPHCPSLPLTSPHFPSAHVAIKEVERLSTCSFLNPMDADRLQNPWVFWLQKMISTLLSSMLVFP